MLSRLSGRPAAGADVQPASRLDDRFTTAPRLRSATGPATAPHLQHNHPDLATRIETLTRHAEQLRHHSNDQRRTV
ncbi:hypothetical protein ACFVJH_34575 [Streptomyces decoyicus]|uniref:hypothetical protein n=1 Tax=Streptomyces decoyicus TaxID=249567 RepID=UPI00362F98E9